MKELKAFFDTQTCTLTYAIYDLDKLEAIIIDPVWDIDIASGEMSESQHQKVKDFLIARKLKPILVMETHAHADHLSGAALMKRDFPQIKVAIGKYITEVQEIFAPIFNIKNLNTKGEQFDFLLEDEQVFNLGSFEIKVFHTPGHTPACCSYLIEGHLFSGDALFMPDSGTGRCDFPKGSAKDLYRSIMKLYQLPDETLVHPCHDYQPEGRELRFEATIAEHKKNNIQFQETTSEAEFVSFRQSRDATLDTPKLLFPSLQVNIRAGRLPSAEDNNTVYLKLPLKLK